MISHNSATNLPTQKCVFVLCWWISVWISVSEVCSHPVTKKDHISHNCEASVTVLHSHFWAQKPLVTLFLLRGKPKFFARHPSPFWLRIPLPLQCPLPEGDSTGKFHSDTHHFPTALSLFRFRLCCSSWPKCLFLFLSISEQHPYPVPLGSTQLLTSPLTLCQLLQTKANRPSVSLVSFVSVIPTYPPLPPLWIHPFLSSHL